MSYALLRLGLTNREAGGATIKGLFHALKIASDLVAQGFEFHVEPLPEDEWQFTVKREAIKAFDAIIDEAAQAGAIR